MKTVLKKAAKKALGAAISILCAPLAPFIIAYYWLYVRTLKKMQNDFSDTDRGSEPSKAKVALSLLGHLIAISALNAPLSILILTKAKGKLASHVFATYVTLAFIAACELGQLKHRSPTRSR
jgi:tellurite resistance protein TehA-like permease